MTYDPDELPMGRAADLAWDAVGLSSPNPPVGCIILDPDRQPAGEGTSARPGGPHAEITALASAGDRARGGTAYVTLEPCGHHGRTGPCADALIAAGIRRVVYAVAEPQPAHRGAGSLRTAGIEVSSGVAGAAVAAGALRFWLHRLATGRPYVTWKFAATLDGRVAAADGTSRWITGPAARDDVQRLRRQADAVIVGTGTVLADNPHLTARDVDGRATRGRQPVRVVVGRRVIPPDAHVLDHAAPTVHLTQHDPTEVLDDLARRGALRVLLEAGPTLCSAFLRAGAVDDVVAYLAPALLGAGPPAAHDLGIASIAAALRLEPRDVSLLGPDVRVTADLIHRRTPEPTQEP